MYVLIDIIILVYHQEAWSTLAKEFQLNHQQIKKAKIKSRADAKFKQPPSRPTEKESTLYIF